MRRLVAAVDGEVAAAIAAGRTLPVGLHAALAVALDLDPHDAHSIVAAAAIGRGAVRVEKPGAACPRRQRLPLTR